MFSDLSASSGRFGERELGPALSTADSSAVRISPHQVAARESGDESPHSETGERRRTRQCYHLEEQLNHIALELRDGERRDSCGLWPLGLVEEVVPAAKSTNYPPRDPQNTLT